jgi:hypothetical protein
MTGPAAHATLGPSGAHRWLNCPGSIRVSAQVQQDPGSTSPAALEGTIAHALMEIEGKHAFGQTSREEYLLEYEAWRTTTGLDLDTVGEMAAHIEGMVNFLKGRMSLLDKPTILFEQRMSSGIHGVWGTSDVVIVDATTVEIWDLKYGVGYLVDPEGNEQLLLYGLGALDTYGDIIADTTTVVLGIYQPRINGGIRWHETTPEDMREWRETVARPGAALAMTDDAPIVPSEKACTWCPARGECEVRAKWIVGEDFGAPYVEVQRPDLLDEAEMSMVLDRIPAIEAWCKDVQAAAMTRLYTMGEEIPGYKAVRSGGRRGIKDHAAAIQTFIDAGFPADEVATFKTKSLGELEKIIKKRWVASGAADQVGAEPPPSLDEILGDLIEKSEGSISMVKATDKREAVNSLSEARKDFS